MSTTVEPELPQIKSTDAENAADLGLMPLNLSNNKEQGPQLPISDEKFSNHPDRANMRAILSDPENLGGKLPDAVASSKTDANPQEYRDITSNARALSFFTGNEASDISLNYEKAKQDFVKQQGWDMPKNESEFRSQMAGYFNTLDNREDAVDALRGDAMADAVAGHTGISRLQKYAEWTQEHADALSGLPEAQKFATFQQEYWNRVHSFDGQHLALAAEIADRYGMRGEDDAADAQGAVEARTTEEDILKKVEGLSREDRQRVFQLAATYEKKRNPVDYKPGFSRSLYSIGQAFQRSAKAIGALGEGGTPRSRIAMEIRSAAQNIVNPLPYSDINPVDAATKGLPVIATKIAQGFGEAAPAITMTAASGGWVGGAYMFAQNLAQEKERLLLANPEMTEQQAERIAGAIAVPVTALQSISYFGLATKFPALEKSLGKWAGTEVGKFALNTGVGTAAFSLSETVSPLADAAVHALNPKFNVDSDPGKELKNVLLNAPKDFGMAVAFSVLHIGHKVDVEKYKQETEQAVRDSQNPNAPQMHVANDGNIVITAPDEKGTHQPIFQTDDPNVAANALALAHQERAATPQEDYDRELLKIVAEIHGIDPAELESERFAPTPPVEGEQEKVDSNSESKSQPLEEPKPEDVLPDEVVKESSTSEQVFTFTSKGGNEYVKRGEQWFSVKDGIETPEKNAFKIKAAENGKVEANAEEQGGNRQEGGENEPAQNVAGEEGGNRQESQGSGKVGEDAGKISSADNKQLTKKAESLKKLLSAKDSEGGFIDVGAIRDGLADYGRSIYEKGQNFADWSKRMIADLGEKVRSLLAHVWNFLKTDGGRLRGKEGERGSVGTGSKLEDAIRRAGGKPDASYAEKIAEKIDSLSRSPAERLQAMERAKERLSDVLRRRDELIADLRGQGHEAPNKNTDSKVESLKATHADEVKRIDKETQRQLDNAQTPRERNGINLSAISRKNAANRRLSEEIASITGKTLDRARQLSSLRELDAILTAFPPEVRGQIGGFAKLADLKTDAARQRFFTDRLDRLNNVMERVLRAKYSERFDKILDKAQPKGGAGEKPVGKIGVEGHRAFKEIERAAGLSKEDASRELDGIDKALEEIDPKDIKGIVGLFEKRQYLEAFGNWEGKTAEERAAALKIADGIYKTGRNAWLIQEESRLSEVASLRSSIIKGQGKTGTDSELIESKEANGGAKGFAKGLASRFRSFTQVLETVLGKDNPVTERWHKADVKASGRFEKALVDINMEMQKFLKTVYPGMSSLNRGRALWKLRAERNITVEKIEGRKVSQVEIPIDKARDILDGKLEMETFGLNPEDRQALRDAVSEWSSSETKKKSVTIETVTAKGEKVTVPLTAMEAIDITMIARQRRYAELMSKHGWTPDVIAKIDAALPDDAKLIRAWFAKKYEMGHASINEVYQKMNGVDLPKEENYAPASFKHDAAETTPDVYGNATVSGEGGNTGFTRSRKDHSARPILSDALTKYNQHMAAVEYYKAYAEFSREMNGVIRASDVRDSIEAGQGKRSLDSLLDWVKTISDSGPKMRSLGRELDEFARRLTGSSAYIGLSWQLATTAKHLLSVSNAAARMPLHEYAKGFAKLLAGQLEVSHIWNADFIQNRLHGDWSPEQKAAMAKSWETAPSRRQLFLDLGTHILPFVDTVATTGGAAIHYDYQLREAKKMGMNDEQAHKYAMDATEDMVYRTAYPATMTQRSLAELGSAPMGKLLWLFATPHRQKMGMFLTAAEHAMTGEGSKKELARVLFVTHIVGGLFAQGITSAWRSAHDEEESDFFNEHDWNPKDFLIAALAGPLKSMPFIGDLIEHAEGKTKHTAIGSMASGADASWKLIESATGNLSDSQRKALDKDPWRWYMNKATDAMNLVGYGMSNGFEALPVAARLLNDRRKEIEKMAKKDESTN